MMITESFISNITTEKNGFILLYQTENQACKSKRMYKELDNDSPYPMKVKFYNVKKYQCSTPEVTTLPTTTVSNENISNNSFWGNWWIYAIVVVFLITIGSVIYKSKR